MARRGFTLIEMSVVLAAVAVLSSVGFLGYSAIRGSVDEANARNTVRAVVLVQQRLYQREGVFSDDLAELAGLHGDPDVDSALGRAASVEYLSGSTASTAPDEVSVLVTTYAGRPAVAIAAAKGTSCSVALVAAPDIESVYTGSRTGVSCKATNASQWVQ